MKAFERNRGFTLVELMIVVAIMGILAAIAIPGFLNYIRRSKTSEAVMNIRKIFDGSVSYIGRSHNVSRSGQRLPMMFPVTVAATPTQDYCADGTQKFTPELDTWDAPSWRALNFSLSDPHFYKYSYTSEGEYKTSSFTAHAFGNLKCNELLSTFERVGSVDDYMNVVGGHGVYIVNGLE